MQLDSGNIISVFIGGLLVFAVQWFASRQSARTEALKWKQEKLREVRRDVVRFREERSKRVFEALDRVAHRWDVDSIIELADAVGYEGEKVDVESEEYKQRKKEQKQKYLGQMKEDISSANVIHDPDIRKAVSRILWQSTNPELIPDKDTPTLQDTYLKLENWIFNPQIDYNSVQHSGKGKGSITMNTETENVSKRDKILNQEPTLKDIEEHLKRQDRETKKTVYGSYAAFGGAIIMTGVSLLVGSKILSASTLFWEYVFLIVVGFGVMFWSLCKQQKIKHKI